MTGGAFILQRLPWGCNSRHMKKPERAYGGGSNARFAPEAAGKHEDAKADLDEFAAKMVASTHSLNHSKRLDSLRSSEMLSKSALRLISRVPNEAARRNGIKAVLARMKSMRLPQSNWKR